MAHPLASHCEPPAQFPQARSRAELLNENLPLEGVSAVTTTAFQHNQSIAQVSEGWPVAATEVLPSSRHLISNSLGVMPERRLPTRSEIHRQGADDDKNIFNGDAHLARSATKLIPLAESSRMLILGLDSCHRDHLDAADNKEQIENNQVPAT